ncbi:MAG: Uma2 family endonuclease [Selenomonas sp.]|uniref:Uma2 family endonuclease n=1 Tax=Selenomonas sp. TaxID=2053611 RepID=UPI0025FCAE9B|nr:Uma2 family endonuclease [Selenomonas sp.]MCI6232882.1 Uma2 family endonuclease [Selenomonas sp.]
MDNLARTDLPVTELIDGKIYSMSPRPRAGHNFVAANIYRIFANYLDGKSCTAIMDGMDLFLDEENHYVPDAMIVCDASKIHRDGVHGAPDLVVEVLSPSTMRNDRGAKMQHYAAAGVKEYWLVTPLGKNVEVYLGHDGQFRLDEVYTEYDAWDLERMEEEERHSVRTEIPVSLSDDFHVQVADIFKGIDKYV